MKLSQDYTFLVGSYSAMDVLAHQPYAPIPGKGIYAMTLSSEGKLHLNSTVAALNPAVLIPHSDGKSIYAILETIQTKGQIIRYTLDKKGNLDQQETFNASGKSTCYLALSPNKDAAIVINYWDAIIDVVDIGINGELGEISQSFKQYYRPKAQWRQVESREDHWVNRQVGPHAHCAHYWHDWVFIPDLGENAIFQYRWNAQEKELTSETWIEFEAGSGPRHMVMHPTLDICYISNELFNTVCVAQLDSSEPDLIKPRLIPCQYESTIDDRDNVSYVSEIKLSPDAKFLYVSNRGDNSLATFKVHNDGHIERTAITSTGGKFPRHFTITPDGKAIIVANQDSGHIRVFARNVETGELIMTDEVFEIPAPNYLRFVAP